MDGYRRSAYPERQSVSFPKREVPIRWLPVDIKHKGSTNMYFYRPSRPLPHAFNADLHRCVASVTCVPNSNQGHTHLHWHTEIREQ